MNKLRESTAAILWLLVFSFGVIWVLQDSQMFDNMSMGDAQTLAMVNGASIGVDEYRRAIDNQMEQYRAQTGESVPEQLMDTYRERIFEQLVENKLREQEMDRLGIQVSDAEVIDLVLGDNPDPFIRQTFSDETGTLDQAALRSFLDNPEARDQWIAVEEYLRSKRRQEKLDNLILASVRVSDAEVVEEYLRRNRQVGFSFAALRYAAIPDDSVTVSESDLRDFYDEHREDFKRERTYDVEYVALSKAPSQQDTLKLLQELGALREAFASVEDDSLYLRSKGSERPFTSSYFRPDELDPEIADAVFGEAEPGDVVGPLQVRGEAHLIKILDRRPVQETAVRARHILISAPESAPDSARQAARREALDLLARIRAGEDFAELARQFSDDPGSGARGGELGWFGPDRMVAPFEEAAFGASVGQVVGPVETQFGYHLIEVQERAAREAQIADLVYPITISSSTMGELMNTAEDLAYYASESEDFAGEAASAGLQVQTVQIQEGMTVIPGLGASRSIQNFLATAFEGSISETLDLPEQVVIMHVRDIVEEGYRPFEEVRAELEPRVRLEKKRELQTDRLQAAFDRAGSFEALPAELGVQPQTASNLSYANMVLQGFGREPKVVGAALGVESEGTTVPRVIEGANAAYVIHVTQLNQPDVASIPQATRNQIRQDLLNRKRNQVRSQWLTELRESADVEDYRVRFSI